MKLNIFITCFLIISFGNIYGSEVDSLKKLIPNADTKQRSILLNQIAKTYEQISPNDRIKYAREALKLGRRIGFDSSIVAAYKNLGIGYYYLQNEDSSIHYFKIALDYYSKLEDTLGMSACLNNLGVIYTYLDDYSKGTEYYMRSLRIKEEQKDSAGMAKIYTNLGNFHYRFDRQEKALMYFQKSLAIHKKIEGDSIFYPLSYMNIANVYREMAKRNLGLKDVILKETQMEIIKSAKTEKHFDYFLDAIKYFNKAEAGYLNLKDTTNYYRVLSLRSQIYMFIGDLEHAEKGLLEAHKYFRRIKDIFLIAESATALGSYYLFMKDYNKAINYYKEAIACYTYQYNTRVLLAKQNLAQAQYKSGNYKESFETIIEANEIRDSLKVLEGDQKFIELESKYQSEKKDRRILLLEKDKEIMDSQKMLLILSLVLLGVVIIVIFIIIWWKNRVNKVLNQKNIELKDVNQNLTQSQKELKEANDAKDKFFSIMAHDLRNPISTFKQLTEILSDDFDSFEENEKKEFLEEMKKSSSNLYNLLENLLTWSRSKRGAIQAKPTVNDVYSIADMTLSHLKSQAKNKKIELINNIPLKTEALFYPHLTSTIIRNLVTNAIKFSEDGSIIEINIMGNSNDNEFTIEIKDYGLGMEEKTLDKLFRIDQSVSQNGTKGETGTGLGLIICKEFAEKQDGNIWAESEPGKGSSFCFTLPRYDEKSEQLKDIKKDS